MSAGSRALPAQTHRASTQAAARYSLPPSPPAHAPRPLAAFPGGDGRSPWSIDRAYARSIGRPGAFAARERRAFGLPPQPGRDVRRPGPRSATQNSAGGSRRVHRRPVRQSRRPSEPQSPATRRGVMGAAVGLPRPPRLLFPVSAVRLRRFDREALPGAEVADVTPRLGRQSAGRLARTTQRQVAGVEGASQLLEAVPGTPATLRSPSTLFAICGLRRYCLPWIFRIA
jgi:hypothetical protein